jgi:hypothetical protein
MIEETHRLVKEVHAMLAEMRQAVTADEKKPKRARDDDDNYGYCVYFTGSDVRTMSRDDICHRFREYGDIARGYGPWKSDRDGNHYACVAFATREGLDRCLNDVDRLRDVHGYDCMGEAEYNDDRSSRRRRSRH